MGSGNPTAPDPRGPVLPREKRCDLSPCQPPEFVWSSRSPTLTVFVRVQEAADRRSPSTRLRYSCSLGAQSFLATNSAAHSLKRSEEHTSELQSLTNLVCRLLLEKKP